MQVSWKQSYSTRFRVQDVRLRHRSRLQSLPAWSRHVFTRASLSGRDRSNSKRIGIGSVVGALFTRATAKTNRGQYDRSNVGVR